MQSEVTEKKESAPEQKNYPVIDLAKFVCSLLVFLIHVSPVRDPSAPNLSAALYRCIEYYISRIAVPYFFIASGFLLFRRSSFEKYDSQRTKRYLLRLLRIYLIWTVIYFPLSLFWIVNDEAGIVHGVLKYLHGAVFTGSFLHLWYLPALIFAVFLVSLLITGKVRPGKILMISAGFYILGLFAQSWFGFILPLRAETPALWDLLLKVKSVIITTRNGLFEGFLFVAMGMYIAFQHLRIPLKKSLPLFAVSFLALGLEILLLFRAKFVREYDMYLFLAPSAFFLFILLLEIDLPDHPVFVTLRHMSSLLFYSHFWGVFLTKKILLACAAGLLGGFYEFIITLFLSLAISGMILYLSGFRRFQWLKALYS